VVTSPTKRSFPQQRLDSWKAIAGYLGHSCRTVQRWHVTHGLPVHHFCGLNSSVFAYVEELEEWIKTHNLSTTDHPAERNNNVLLPFPISLHEPAPSNDILDFPLIQDSEKARSDELVAHAYRLWITLSPGNLPKIAQLFHLAADLDPNSAEAYAGLSHALIAESLWGILRAPYAYNSAHAALKRALEIDPELPNARCAEAWLKLLVTRDWKGARRGFEKASKHPHLRIRSNVGLAVYHLAAGHFPEAFRILLEVEQQNPLSPTTTAWNIWASYLAGEYTKALFQIEQFRVCGFQGPVVDAVEALVTIQLEEPNAQIERIEALTVHFPHNDVLQGALGHAYGVAGQDQMASKILDAIMHPEVHEPYAAALVLIGLNRKQEAVRCLEQSYREGVLWSLGFPFDPILASLRNDPLYRQFLSKVSYPTLANNKD